ncbi:UNKNOWN [Stylonychia lemnae]|uniref:Glycosyltransferase 2-like domain-containing protein n=1 Tax=Stylonychia lemnae TaxID=5949 RepID=A0A078A2V5_STYLE|nr:UNKNOWN [Stylonychia lemnae]|eukprot:CDW76445.1 UNKNOWN [Stylonychia lemnae]
MATILIYGDGSIQDLERNIDYTMNQTFLYHEVFVAVKSQQILDQINLKLKAQENIIQFIETNDIDDFAKILQGIYHQINGEYIVMIHTKTQSKITRIRNQVKEAKTCKCNAIVSDLEIVNDAGKPWDNSYLIDLDYNRNLDLILFSMDFRFEVSLLLRKKYLAYILQQSPQINRYYVISEIVKSKNLYFMREAVLKISLNNYHHVFVDHSIIKPQQDADKFMLYDSYLNKRDIKIPTLQFSQLLNCSYDFLGCDEQNLGLVGYLMIDLYLNFNEGLFKSLKKLKIERLNQIELIYSHLSKLEKARLNPNEHPLASVIMTCFNRDYYLLRSIQHVLQQTYVNWELVISDDGSNNPKSLQILQLVSNHPKIRVQYLYTNQNTVFGLNYAILQAKGEYFVIQDDDDIMLQTRLNYQIDFLRKNQEYELCGSPYLPVSQIGEPEYQNNNYVESFAKLKFYFLFVNYIPHSNYAIRLSDKIRKHYLYNHQTACDYSLWLKLLFEVDENIRFAVLPNYIGNIALHKMDTSQINRDS